MPVDPQLWISQIAGRFIQGVRPSDPLFRYYQEILTRFASHVVGPFSATGAAGVTCTVQLQGRASCGEPAAGSCAICSQGVCLRHGCVWIEDGSIVCGNCVAPLYTELEADTGHEVDARRGHHLKVLGFEPDAAPNDIDIRRAYKKLVAKYHPDKFARKSPRAQAAAHRKLQAINEAFHALQRRRAG